VILIVDVCLYAVIVLASVLLLLAVCFSQQWLLVPWLFLMALVSTIDVMDSIKIHENSSKIPKKFNN
jgi:hypothetical protein